MNLSAQERIAFIEKNFMVKAPAEEGAISYLVPMLLYPNQRHYIENRTVRDVIVKGRQMGQSTGIEADNSAILFTSPYQNQTIITHDAEVSEFLFQNVQRFYRHLPWNRGVSEDQMQPKHDWKSGTRMRFPVIDSYIYIDSAKSDTIGVGHGLNVCHLSEVAKYPDKKARQLWADITQTVPPDGFITAESTPQGRTGLFYEIYQDAKRGINGFKPFFYPWWWNLRYKADSNIYMTAEKAENIAMILGQSTLAYLKEEKLLAEMNKLSLEQLAFRRMKLGEIKVLFFQEYPENEIDCWLSNEMSIIEAGSLKPYFSEVREGRQEGNLIIWKDAIGGHRYVIGADVASGTARDFSVASVLDAKNMEYVARLKGKIHTDLFAEQLFHLGLRYNKASLAVERIGHGHSVLRVLLEKNYPNLYYHMDYDEFINANITDVGWKTSAKTKLPMVNGLITAMRAHDLISYSIDLLEEISALTWIGGIDSKIATTGHDDEFMSLAIALQVREQAPLMSEEFRPKAVHYARL